MSAGSKPIFINGKATPEVPNSMVDPRYQPSLLENFVLGVGKAHRGVTSAHFDYRNFNRGADLDCTGKVKE
jgi:hypothetical protein